MTKKYKKRRHSPTVEARRQAEQERLAGEKNKKRWNPAGRALLYIDLVFLATASILDVNHLTSEAVSGALTILGVILLLVALWLLFGPRKGGFGTKR